MRGIGSGFYGGMGFSALLGAGVAAAISGAAGHGAPFGSIRQRRESRATGWQDRPFEHPEGETSYRPTGSKRARRRAARRGK